MPFAQADVAADLWQFVVCYGSKACIDIIQNYFIGFLAHTYYK